MVEVVPVYMGSPAVEDRDASLLSLLSPDERNRANRFLRSEPRHQYIRGRAALRVLLGLRLALAPQDVPLQLTAAGKPLLAGNPLHCNISHSAKLLVCAFCADAPVGVDVERISTLPEMHLISRQCFPPEEAPKSAKAFLQSWTRREAYLKALGTGLGHGEMASIRFAQSAIDPGRASVLHGDRNWYVQDFAPLPEYVGAVSFRGDDPVVDIHPSVSLSELLEVEVYG